MSDSEKQLRAAPRRQMVEFGTEHHQVRHGDDPAYTDAREPIKHGAHHHAGGHDPIDPASIGAALTEHKHTYRDLTGVAAESHRHPVSEIDGAAGEQHRHTHQDLDGVAAERHAHRIGDLVGVAADKHQHDYLDLKGVAAVKHTHVADEIIAGVFDVERVMSHPIPGSFLRVSDDGRRLEPVDIQAVLFCSETVARLRELLAENSDG